MDVIHLSQIPSRPLYLHSFQYGSFLSVALNDSSYMSTLEPFSRFCNSFYVQFISLTFLSCSFFVSYSRTIMFPLNQVIYFSLTFSTGFLVEFSLVISEGIVWLRQLNSASESFDFFFFFFWGPVSFDSFLHVVLSVLSAVVSFLSFYSVVSFSIFLSLFLSLVPVSLFIFLISFPIQFLVGWSVGWILWHINLCRLFNVKSILYK